MSYLSHLQHTIRALEILAELYKAWDEDDFDRAAELLRQGPSECGIEFLLVSDRMKLGEIPTPQNPDFDAYLDRQRARLPQPTDTKDGA